MTDLVDTRLALHAVAERVLSPLRVQATGNEIALCVRAGGFGTPDLPQGGWAGFLDGDVVRVAADGSLTREPLRSLRQAARVVGLADPDALADDPLIVSDAAAQVLARTWADGEAALHGLLATLSAEDAGSDINLWPEHFDIAIDAGDATTGARATYGVSPGDATHRTPYAYVAPWRPPPSGPLWQAAGFVGAERPAADPKTTLTFWQLCRSELVRHAGPVSSR